MRENKTENEHKNTDRIESYFVTLSEAARLSGYTPEHLNLLCRKGILRGKKVGRNWQTTREWLNEFLFLAKSDKKKYQRRKRRRAKNEFIQEDSDKSSELISKSDEIGSDNFSVSETVKEKKDISEEREINTEKEEAKKENYIPRWVKIIFDFSVAVFISFLIFFGVSFFQYVKTKDYLAEKNIPADISEDTFLLDQNSGIVAGDSVSATNYSDGGKVKGEEAGSGIASIASSENYKLKEISFGGVLLASANGENLPIEISDVKSEIFSTKDGKQAQVLISWKTNKLAVSEMEYSKNNTGNPKTLQEKFYGFNHSVVLTKLDLATTYVYQIKTKDRWGNEISSERFGIYTGSKMVSVFDLIIKAMDETFGWAVKK